MDNNTNKKDRMIVSFDDQARPSEPEFYTPNKNWKDELVTKKYLVVCLGVSLALNILVSMHLASDIQKCNEWMLSERSGSEHDTERYYNEYRSEDAFDSKDDQDSGGSDIGKSEPIGKASLGVIIAQYNSEESVYIAKVNSGNAKKAGLKEGDIIVAIDGTSIKECNDVIDVLSKHSKGDTVTLTIERDGKKSEIKTELE